MRSRLIEIGIPVAAAVVGIFALGLGLKSALRAPRLPQRSLGIEQFPDRIAAGPGAGKPITAAQASGGSSAAVTTVIEIPGEWPHFRGPNRDGVSPENTPLARSWPASGPRPIWAVPLGEGYAGAAVHAGRAYVMDYDQPAQSDALRCFSLANGAELWRRSYPVVVKRNHGMSRTVPAIADGLVVTLGPKCHLMCCDARTGEVKWLHDLVAEFGVTVPEWYAGECPVIDNKRVIVGTGGSALVMAFELATGKVVWKSPNPGQWLMTHSSILPVQFGGKRMYIYCGSGGVAAVSADKGELLWQTDRWTINTATVPTPLDIGGGKLFLSGGYEAGAMMLQMAQAGGKFSVAEIYRLKPSVFGSDQQTPVLYKGYIYGVVPGGQLTCISLDGKTMWQSGATNRFGLGPYAIAGGILYVMDDKGQLSAVEATEKGFKPLAVARVLEGPDAWGPFAIAGGRLLARDLTRLVCLDITGK